MSAQEKDFLSLLEKVTENYTLQVPNSQGSEYKFKSLTTEQLRNIVQTVVDSSTAQISFHSAIYNTMKQNYIGESDKIVFNILDKLLYIIDNRIQAVSPTLFIRGDGDSFIPVDLNEVKLKLTELIKNNPTLSKDAELEVNNISVEVGIPTIEVENTINQEVYANMELDSNEVQSTLGKVFLTEILKWIKSVTIEEANQKQEIIFSALPPSKRMQILEKLPASITEKIIDYIEKTKQTIDSCLIVSNRILPLNGSLFSVR